MVLINFLLGLAQTFDAVAKEPFETVQYDTVVVPAGSFRMGCARGAGSCWRYEKPRHLVSIGHQLEVMKTEVTQELYVSVTGTEPWLLKENDNCTRLGKAAVGASHPAHCISWTDAVVFANSLSVSEGLKACYRVKDGKVFWSDPTCEGWRLPTEAEWEYAARGNTKNPFSGGRDANQLAWYFDNSSGKSNPVAQLLPNSFGLYDMSGNVFEWSWDWFDSYVNLSVSDPKGPSVGSFRVRRGGSWYDAAHACRISDRYGSSPDYRSDHVGFRLFRLIAKI